MWVNICYLEHCSTNTEAKILNPVEVPKIFKFICNCLNCNYLCNDDISSFNICISAVHIIFMFHSFCRLGLTQQIGLLPIFLNNSLQFYFLFHLYLVLISKKQKKNWVHTCTMLFCGFCLFFIIIHNKQTWCFHVDQYVKKIVAASLRPCGFCYQASELCS